ncbi:uncharacterized protein LOC110247780 [Exaiptasia diaphana]|uniref:Integrase catalytic domain-containing protein n=1 Tax=Exaiptasia diaphana TaxID=2652724 RepID=A0A913YQW8_EXADI|nr:uncharacterized protein LOC110247780 [Exaiptasia diaphana]
MSSSIQVTDDDAIVKLIERYSSWNRLKRAVAWLLKFKLWLQTKKTCQSKSLTVNDLNQAETTIIKHIQRQAYPEVIKVFNGSDHRQVKAKLKGLPSSLHGLSPIIDEQGVLRVGGRLENSSVRHQIILPRCHRVTDLIIQACHEDCGHLGESYVLSHLRQRYWVIKGKSAVRRVIGKCFLCKRMNSLPMTQMMGELPKERVKPDDPPFTSVGVDFFGPIYVRQRRSHVKRYGCIFTCLATRATHIEVVESLDTDSFINAYRRFANTRGNPSVVYSDNGTNLRAGEREIHKAIQEWNQDKINQTLSQKNVQWYFNPPKASHMGGVWERVIRSIRKIMRAILGSKVVTDEVLRTTMSEVQAILNSRPLTPLSNDVKDMEVLTPNHLLLLRSNANLPLGLHSEEHGYCRRRWKQVQHLANVFWQRWLKEYLPIMQVRQKWLRPQRNLQDGDLVLIADENTPRGKWPIGKVTKVNKGRDGLVRSACLSTSSGSMVTRPITKLCFLEHQEQ